MEVPQNRIRSLGNSTAKPPRPLEIPHYFLFGHPFKFLLLFLWYPWKFHTYPLPLPPPRLVFFWNSPFDCLMTASWLATYLLASSVVFYVLGSHQPSGGKSLLIFPFDFWWEFHGFYTSVCTYYVPYYPPPPLRRGRTWGLSSECKTD